MIHNTTQFTDEHHLRLGCVVDFYATPHNRRDHQNVGGCGVSFHPAQWPPDHHCRDGGVEVSP